MVREDLRPEMDGKEIVCLIYGIPVKGILIYEDGNYFILNNTKDGASCNNKRGYKYSWQWDSNVDKANFVIEITEIW